MNDTLLGTDPTDDTRHMDGSQKGEVRSREGNDGWHAPSKLWVCDEVIPGLPQIGKQPLDLLVHEAIGDCLDRLTDLWEIIDHPSHRFGSSASLSLTHTHALVAATQPTRAVERRLTMSFPRPIVNVMPYPTRSEFVYSEMYAEE